mmetsp:Transcript_41372/g.66450  ORF Transcript_41372/g.66450 Transcript_41372/m.66450 type:complete len:253 (-) Transcript_41372:94-852(-)
MPGIWIISRLHSRMTDIVHNLMLPFPRDIMARVYNGQFSPKGVFLYLQPYKVLKVPTYFLHKLGTRRDAIGIKLLPGLFLCHRTFPKCLRESIPAILCTCKPTGTLLVHLCTWCTSIDCKDQYLLRSNNMHHPVNIRKHPQNHILHANLIGHILIIRMCTIMNNTIHIQIHVIKLWQELGILSNLLIDQRIPLRNPSVKLWNPHFPSRKKPPSHEPKTHPKQTKSHEITNDPPNHVQNYNKHLTTSISTLRM